MLSLFLTVEFNNILPHKMTKLTTNSSARSTEREREREGGLMNVLYNTHSHAGCHTPCLSLVCPPGSDDKDKDKCVFSFPECSFIPGKMDSLFSLRMFVA